MGGRWSLGAAVAVAIGVATAGMVAHADAPRTPGAQAVATRQAHFKDQGRTFKAIIDELKKDQPEKAVIATNAAKLENLASQLPTWFPKGSGPEAGVKTGAKPEVWSDPNGFATVAAGLRTETAKLDQFAQAGDLAALKTQVRAVGGACKACHDKYRVPETH
jgi:cytochrome c556